MLENLLLIDGYIFYFINGLPHIWLIDYFALFLSGVSYFGIMWLIIGLYIYLREEKKDHYFLSRVISASLTVYVIVELVIKPLVGRLRPSAIEGALIEKIQAGTFSFPSGHAAFAFAMAVVLSQKEPKYKKLLYLLAIFVSLSRIYLGRHYPFDVIVGGLIGYAIWADFDCDK